jgi:hypothetical protein
MTDRTDRPHDRPHDRDDASGPVSAAAGGAAGGAAGAAAGAVAGTLTLGPVGTIVGALVGALGGGWAGLAAAEMPGPGAEDEAYFREHHASTGAHLADASYDRVAPAYHLGHLAARNPDYRGRGFDDVEPDLRRGWSDDVAARHGTWTSARGYARAAYERAARNAGAQPAAIADATPVGTTPSHDRASANDRLAADAPVAGNPNASAPLAASPEHPGGSAPGWIQSPSEQGGFGARRAPGSVRDSDTGEDVR